MFVPKKNLIIKSNFLLILFFVLLFLWAYPPLLFAKTPDLNFQEDRKVQSISNLKYVESASKYASRKIGELQQTVEQIKSDLVKLQKGSEASEGKGKGQQNLIIRIQDITKRLDLLENQLRDSQILDERIAKIESVIHSNQFLNRSEFEQKIKALQQKIDTSLQKGPETPSKQKPK